MWVQLMISLSHPTLLAYLAFAALVVSQLPRLGRSVLAFLRDLDDYRANRPQRK
ncbi:MAG TPA: hypothetical protein VFJ76_06620 [Solirubrobacterales bacterium]|nr:hypothetical protein [Solirubrobacterales bacterium]